ncbi:hypothetical protein [Streptomyces sp. x-45]|uniref:hypothetical protein n=1 Tax=Streptomyces sp. x-45 TaxID=2789281 RepID=UPI0022CCC45F|nr:hypothetical protein [Streptomyces diastatochromogenes]
MSTAPYTDDDLRAEAARQRGTLTQDPDFMGVGEQMEGDLRWAELNQEQFGQAQQTIYDLINNASDLSQWAVALGADGLEPFGTLNGPGVRILIAVRPDVPQELRGALVENIGAEVAQLEAPQLSAHTVEELEDELAAARARLIVAEQRKSRREVEVELLEERIVHQQLADALAEDGFAGVLRWWVRGHDRPSSRYARRVMTAWLRSFSPQLWCPDHPPTTNPRHPVRTCNIAWNVSLTTQEETSAIARSFNSIGSAVRPATCEDRTVPDMNIQVIPPCTELRFGVRREPCLNLRPTREGWELVTAVGTPITVGSSGEDCRALLVQAQTIALSGFDGGHGR